MAWGIEELVSLSSVSRALLGVAERVKSGVKPADSIVLNRANTILASISESIESIASSLKKMDCMLTRSSGKSEVVKSVCGGWRIYEADGRVLITRTDPGTVISWSSSMFIFYEKDTKLEIKDNTARLCRGSYCKEVDLFAREKWVDDIPQIFYLLRRIQSYSSKILQSMLECARREAPECVRA